MRPGDRVGRLVEQALEQASAARACRRHRAVVIVGDRCDAGAREAAVGRWLDDVRGLLERWLPEIVRENRSSVTVAIGCTGGRHRSVYLAESLAAAFAPKWRVLVRHRHLAAEEGK